MRKTEYTELFDGFAKTAIKTDTDGHFLYGHNVSVTLIGDVWDVYLSNQKEYTQGNRVAYLGTGKLNNLCHTLPGSVKVSRLDGEAYFRTKDIHWLKSWLHDNRVALGIAKRRKAPTHGFGAKK